MARKRRRRAKFKPFRMTARFQKAVLVGLCGFLMIVFFVPTGTCRPGRRGGRDPQSVAWRVGGRKVTFGELDELRTRWALVFGGGSRQVLSDRKALDILARVYEAKRLGIRASDAEVLDTIHNGLFPSRTTVEYVFARHSDFEGKAERAKAAVEKARAEIVGLGGPLLRTAFERVAKKHKLSRGESRPFTARTAKLALYEIRGVPNIVERAFGDEIGAVSELISLADRTCIFRVTERTIGFGSDGVFYPEQEGWVGEGYGVGQVQQYKELLRDRRLTQAQVRKTVRESIAYDLVYRLYADSVVGDGSALPAATVRERYVRDNTQAIAAQFSLNASDFASGISYTEDELRSFYGQHKSIERTGQRVGYLRPERVAIEYVLGKKSDVEKSLSDRELRKYYETHKAEFNDSYETALPAVRSRLAEQELERLVGGLVVKAAERAGLGQKPDLAGLADEASRQAAGAFERKKSELFSARDAGQVVPDLRGGKLADELFGEKGQQYLLAGSTRKKGDPRRFISTALSCSKGTFFFRVLRREDSAEILYDGIPAATRERLIQDLTDHKAAEAAQNKAREYRSKIYKAAFDALAKTLAVKPTDTGFLLHDNPVPPVGEPVPALYDDLSVAAAGQLSKVVRAGARFLIARLVEREDAKGLKLQLLAFRKADLPKGFGAAYRPALYERQARYDDDPYRFLDKPKPIPFEKVQKAIARLLTQRRALDRAAERIEAALGDYGDGQDAKLADIAKKRQLALAAGVKVDLAHPEAAAQVGKAAGFRDAVTSLEPGKVSEPLASSQGRFFFVLRSRGQKAATIDVVAALYARIRSEAKVEGKDVRKYYDAHRDTAYVSDDEIKEAPAWDDLPAAAQRRVRKDLREQWAKQPLLERLSRLRTGLLLEAFRTVPPKHPLEATRPVRLTVRDTGPFKPQSPPPFFKESPALLAAIRKLGVGQVSEPLETQRGALLALVKTKTDKTLDIAYATIQNWEVAPGPATEEPSDDELKKHYDAHTKDYRAPDKLQIEYLAVGYDDLVKRLTATDDEVRKEYDRGVKARDTTYRDHTQVPDYVPLPFAKVQDTAQRQVLHRKARQEAERLLTEAHKALKAEGAARDFKTLAAKLPPLESGLSSFFQRDRRTVKPIGLAPELVKRAFAAKEGQTIGPVYGLDGACLARRHEFRAAHVPPFEEVRAAVLADYRRRQANRKALAAAAKLRKQILPAVEKSQDKAEAFRNAIEAEPLRIAVPKPVRVTVTRPFYPLGAPRARINSGAARHPAFVRAVFALRPAELSDVILTEDRAACLVAMPTRFIRPDEPEPYQLDRTRSTMAQFTGRLLDAAWEAYLGGTITSDR